MNAIQTQQATNRFHDVKGVVAVDQHVPSAGAIVWWRLSGHVSYEALKTAWDAAGLEEKDLLSPCSNTVALRRAAISIREKRMLVRPLGRREGFAIVREKLVAEAKELDHDVLCKVTLDQVGRPKIETVGDPNDQTRKIEAEVKAAFDRSLNELDCEDFSSWLVRMMPKMDAVSLRDTGGVYFVPPATQDRLGKVAGVLREVTGHIINRVPAMRGDDAVSAILDAVEQEATQESERMEKDIEAATLGERGFENRIGQCDEVESKVTRYEELLGRKLDSIRERLETLRANLTVAMLKAQSNEGKHTQ